MTHAQAGFSLCPWIAALAGTIKQGTAKTMDHSLISADRSTHFKIIAVTLVSALVLVIVGLIARTDDFERETTQLHGLVLKVGKSTTVATGTAR